MKNFIPLATAEKELARYIDTMIEKKSAQSEKILTYENFEGGTKETLFPIKKSLAQHLVSKSNRSGIMKIPHHKVGKAVLFHYSELVLWTKQNQIQGS